MRSIKLSLETTKFYSSVYFLNQCKNLAFNLECSREFRNFSNKNKQTIELRAKQIDDVDENDTTRAFCLCTYP